MARGKSVLTTGEVAKICKVAPRTVSKWFDSGQLIGYRIPGSKDRRIPIDQLVRFMRAHGIPLAGLESGLSRVLVVDRKPDGARRWNAMLGDPQHEVRIAASAFEAGIAVAEFRPNVIVVVEYPELLTREFVAAVRARPELADLRLVAVSGSMSGNGLHEIGFHAALSDIQSSSLRDEIVRLAAPPTA